MSHLAAVAGSHVEETVEFCSYCGRIASDRQRVCSDCGLGVRLQTSAPSHELHGAAFLVVRSDGRVSAASAAAERLLATHGDLVDKPLMTLVADPGAGAQLTRAVALAANGAADAAEVEVDLVGVTRRRAPVHAKVTACGLPPAALVLLERA